VEHKYKSTDNTVYSFKYPVVWCPKYHRQVLVDGVDMRLKEVLGEVAVETPARSDYGRKANQKLHQMLHGATRRMLSYKAHRLGMETALQDEAYTSQTCPSCGHRHKPTGREYACTCGFRYHRDGVGSWNIRQKYLGSGPVVGVMASPTGVRYHPHMRCSSVLPGRERIPRL